ncbi:MAG: hypothetical protein CMM25_08950 [Rhodospirillaceae bacterium]|nr:hypothetical protein [Rhodospirillaceae bacterium]
MKLQLRDIFNAKEAFARLLDEPVATETALHIRGLVNDVNEHFATLEEERNDLIKKLGTEKDGTYEFTPENQQQFMEQFDTMLEREVEYDWNQMSIKDLGEAKISVKDLNTLSFLFTELSKEAEPVAV